MPSSRSYEILTQIVISHQDGDTLPGLLCEHCAKDVWVTGVSLTRETDAGLDRPVAAPDGRARSLEEEQFILGEGPSIEAAREGHQVLEADIAEKSPPRWPAFTEVAIAAGIRAAFVFPLQLGRARLGVLGLYNETPGALDDSQFAEALAFADAAQTLLLDRDELTRNMDDPEPQGSDPVGADPEIHQATGMIAIQATVELSEALSLLRAHAFANHREVVGVARDIVGGRLRFDLHADSP